MAYKLFKINNLQRWRKKAEKNAFRAPLCELKMKELWVKGGRKIMNNQYYIVSRALDIKNNGIIWILEGKWKNKKKRLRALLSQAKNRLL